MKVGVVFRECRPINIIIMPSIYCDYILVRASCLSYHIISALLVKIKLIAHSTVCGENGWYERILSFHLIYEDPLC